MQITPTSSFKTTDGSLFLDPIEAINYEFTQIIDTEIGSNLGDFLLQNTDKLIKILTDYKKCIRDYTD